ncbi:hypothetical protein CCHR01_14828 [Colletotrichum chrysophilum]|uniref:Uncharacterized protein n=1 Tax=Colletotrichum chrysophilum TaxID=1836956 RepID=A0AAD9A8T0_9PEZI|nr:hypothetical protein CCHR01_14828 [Colletotrichum chrysophilum]
MFAWRLLKSMSMLHPFDNQMCVLAPPRSPRSRSSSNKWNSQGQSPVRMETPILLAFEPR